MEKTPRLCYHGGKGGRGVKWRGHVDGMGEGQWRLLRRCLLLTALFLAMGCQAAWLGKLELADGFRQLSSLCLLGAVLLPPYIPE